MASKEDYLDDLLKRIANEEQPETADEEVQPEAEILSETESGTGIGVDAAEESSAEELQIENVTEEPIAEEEPVEDAAEDATAADMAESFPEIDDPEGLDMSGFDIPEEVPVPDMAEELPIEDVVEEPSAEEEPVEDAAAADMAESFPEIDGLEGLDMSDFDISEEEPVPDMAEELPIEDVVEEPSVEEEPAEDAAAADMSESFPEPEDFGGLDMSNFDMPEEPVENVTEEPIAEDMPAEDATEEPPAEEEPVEDAVGDTAQITEAESEDAAGFDTMPETASDLDSVMGMSEDDIARLLAEGATDHDETAAPDGTDVPEEDILSLMGGAGDEDVQKIQSMLEKSDNNEAVDEKIEELLQEKPENEGNSEEGGLPDGGGANDELSMLLGDSRKAKALEKKRLKKEKAAAKKAEREAKKREKLAKKKRGDKDVQDIPVQNKAGEELLFDRYELDRLVARAGKINEDEPEEDAPDEQAVIQEAEGSVPAETEDATADLGLDLGSLFGGSEETPEPGADAEPVVEQTAASENAASEGGNKKKGFIARILAFLMEEDEDEENEDIRLSGENKEILDELDRDGKKIKGGKGGKKDKKKAKPEKEKKPPKAPKPKKEKKPKEPGEPEPYVPPKKRLTLKKALPILLLGLTIGAALFILSNISIDFADKHAAREAYHRGDYMSCYQNLYGKELNESEKVMYGTSESILYIRLWYREYEMFADEGSELEALDSLIQTVKDYPQLYEYASRWNAEGEIYGIYADMLNILSTKYGLTELQAREIAKVRDDVEYTRRVAAIVEGKGYGSWDGTGGTPGQSDDGSNLPDKLPEESELGQGDFVDNQ